MPDIVVTALVDFTHAGRAHVAGDTLAVSPLCAAALRYRKKVALDSDEDRRASLAASLRARDEAPAPVRRRRSYRRRDLSAEAG